MTLSEEKIKEIADGLSAGFTYYVNLETGEVEEIFKDESDFYGFNLEDEDDEIDDSLPDWEKEMIAQSAKIDSWQNCIKIEPLESFESFKIMEAFVDECVTDERDSRFFWRILSGKKTICKLQNECGKW